MDKLNEQEIKKIEEIIKQKDYPVIMMNLNRYKENTYPKSKSYLEWVSINEQMIDAVGGKILWRMPVEGQLLNNGPNEPLDEIICYYYPTHQALLDTRGLAITSRNFELRKDLIDYAIIHRVKGDNPPYQK